MAVRGGAGGPPDGCEGVVSPGCHSTPCMSITRHIGWFSSSNCFLGKTKLTTAGQCLSYHHILSTAEIFLSLYFFCSQIKITLSFSYYIYALFMYILRVFFFKEKFKERNQELLESSLATYTYCYCLGFERNT